MLGILLLASQSWASNIRSKENPVTPLLSKINKILDKELQLLEHDDSQQQSRFSAADVADWFESMHVSKTQLLWGPCSMIGSFFMANLPDSTDPNGGKMACRSGEDDFLNGNFGQGIDGLKTDKCDVALCCVDSIFLGAIRTKQVTPQQVREYYDVMFPTSKQAKGTEVGGGSVAAPDHGWITGTWSKLKAIFLGEHHVRWTESAKLWDAALKSENPPFNKGDIVYVASGLNGNIDNGIENPFVHVGVATGNLHEFISFGEGGVRELTTFHKFASPEDVVVHWQAITQNIMAVYSAAPNFS